MAEKQAYCVKCKKKQVMKNPKEVTMKNGRKAAKGECPDAAPRCSRSADNFLLS